MIVSCPPPTTSRQCLHNPTIHSWEHGPWTSGRVFTVYGTWITIWSQLIIHTLQISIIPVTQKSLRDKHSDKRRINECAQQSQSQTLLLRKNIHHCSNIFLSLIYLNVRTEGLSLSLRPEVCSGPCKTWAGGKALWCVRSVYILLWVTVDILHGDKA